MAYFKVPGYVGKMLRVDLSKKKTWEENLDEGILKKCVGGVGVAAKILYDEVPPGVEWSDPRNRLIWTTGPLAGSGVYGAATFNVTAKGPMTNLAGASQANGYFGAYLKFSGYDGIIFEGTAPNLVYLWIKDGKAEIRDAGHLAGKDVWEVEDQLRKELGVKERDVSIYAIGPAGENKVFYATIVGDRGHVVAHNGMGAVMGSKNLKAVVAYSGKRNFEVHDPEGLKKKNAELFEFAKTFGTIYEWGSGGGFSSLYAMGALPVKNYTTNIYPEHEQMSGRYMRTHFKLRSVPCYQCRIAHVKEVTVTVPVGVVYGSDLAKVEQVTVQAAEEVMREAGTATPGSGPQLRYQGFGDSGINFNVVLKAPEFADQYVLKHELIKKLDRRYREEGIGIPFPTRTVYVQGEKRDLSKN